MEALLKEHERLEKRANLSKAVDDVQILIDQLRRTRDAIVNDPPAAAELLERQHKTAIVQFERVNQDLKDIYGGIGKYGKALEKKMKERPLTFSDQDLLASKTDLINKAIAMHLMREGHFEVASTFMTHADAVSSTSVDIGPSSGAANAQNGQSQSQTQPFSSPTIFSTPPHQQQPGGALHQQQFQEMYSILNSLRQARDLAPAIQWARANSALLEARGSNLEYDLCQLQYVTLFKSGNPGPTAALAYAREIFAKCSSRYAAQIRRLVSALAFLPNLSESPYADLFGNSPQDTTAAAAAAFTSEFCALMSLSSASPLLTAVTAGCIALPTLLKLSQIQQMHRTSWTTASELPVEIPLPAAYKFHSIFVCPVSKEQSTDENPPMMLPCFHVICKESLDRISRGGRFKCPYCPAESHKNDAKRVFV